MATKTKERDALAEEPDPQASLPEDGEHDGAGDGSADEVDIDELLTNPEAFEKADAALRATPGQGGAEDGDAGPEKGGEVQPPAGTAAAAGGEDPDPIVETIEFRGNLIPVRKSEQKALMQKGRSLEHVLEQLSPLRIVAEDADLMGLLHRIRRLPKGKEALKTAIRTAFEQALPEVEGYSRDEVAGGARLVEALLPAFGVTPGGRAPAGGEDAGSQDGDADGLSESDRITIQVNLQAAIDGEPSREDALATLQFVNAAIVQADQMAARGELKGPDGQSIPPQLWQQIRATLNDPRKPEHFRRFFQEMGKQRRAMSAQQKVTVKAGSLPAGANQDRLAGGAAGTGTKSKARDAFDFSDDEWERTLRSL